MNFPDLQLTDYGVAAIIGSVYGTDGITFTGVQVGDGTLPSGTDVRDLSALVNPVKTVGLTSCTLGDGIATLTFNLSLAGLDSAFYLRELGIMATVNAGEEDEQAILYAYTNSGDDAVQVKPDTSGNHANLLFTVHVAVGDAETINAVISEVTGYVTTADFEDHVTDYDNPHQVTKEQVGLGNVPNLAPSDMTVTFTQAGSLTVPTSGSTLSTLMGLLSKAVASLRSHLSASNNPHNVTPAQIGAAASSHTHSASDITSGTLPLTRGGTGVTSKAALKSLVANNPVYTSDTLSSNGWSGSTYSFSSIYPDDEYNIEISLDNSASSSQRSAYAAAMLVGSGSGNTITALGTVPQVDIPIIIRTQEVL